MIAMDMFYAKNMSPRLDLAIILKTIPVLIAQVLDDRVPASQARGENVMRPLAVANRDSDGSIETSK